MEVTAVNIENSSALKPTHLPRLKPGRLFGQLFMQTASPSEDLARISQTHCVVISASYLDNLHA